MSDNKKISGKNLVYSCSGCSTAAQMANFIALKLDRMGLLEMSCIAGVGGGVKPLVDTAKRADKILAIDGCPLKCTASCLENQGVSATEQVVLSDYDVKKMKHKDFNEEQAEEILAKVITIAKRMTEE